ncbi:hypothetical protein HRbin12_01058 [bacterium HR12]|nr:hypothetical protein HRbin12_01058 [bacterium HR12]
MVGEHRVLRLGGDHDEVVRHLPAALRRVVEAEDLRPDPLGEVVLGVVHVPRPRVRDPRLPLRDLLVVAGAHLDVHEVVQLREGLPRPPDGVLVPGVHVSHADPDERHADRLSVLVEEVHLPTPPLVPVDVEGHGKGAGVVDMVPPVPDPRLPGHVGDRVAGSPVVPGILEPRPHVREVGQVRVVEGLDLLGRDELREVLDRGEEQVEADGVVLHLGHRLVHPGELRVLDLDAVLGLERLEDLLVDVVVPVEDAQRARLGRQAVRDGRQVVVQGQRRGAIGRGEQRHPGFPTPRRRRRALAAGCEHPRERGDAEARDRRSPEELSARERLGPLPTVTPDHVRPPSRHRAREARAPYEPAGPSCQGRRSEGR